MTCKTANMAEFHAALSLQLVEENFLTNSLYMIILLPILKKMGILSLFEELSRSLTVSQVTQVTPCRAKWISILS